MNRKKEIIIGFVVGIIANSAGTLLYILLFSDLGIIDTYNAENRRIYNRVPAESSCFRT